MVTKILVVEDEQLVALDIEKRAVRLGYQVATASSGEEALEQVATWRPDLVLMDIKLGPGMDGVEAARRIRDSYDLPVVYLTAYADQQTVSRARITEPYGFVVKPFDERSLAAAVEMALQQHIAHERERQQSDLQRFLANACAQMVASLDVETVAQQAAELIVPRYADWCFVSLSDGEGFGKSFTLSYPKTVGESPTRARGGLIEAVERSGAAELRAESYPPSVLARALGETTLAALRRAGVEPRSVLCAPLVALRQTLGAIAFVSGHPTRRYGPADLAFAEDFAHRLALALSNAALYRRSERALGMRDEVLAVVSHDLRGLLSSIVLNAEKLAKGHGLSHGAEAILRVALRMGRLVDDLLDAAALDAGRLSFEPNPQSVAEVVREALEPLRPLAEEKGITLHERLPDDAFHLAGDRVRVAQVLSNIIGNSIKFSPRGGSIAVRAQPQGPFVLFAVSDEGPGIPPDQLPHLFERFWRGGTRRRGSGLGLYIAKGIVEVHGGRIWVESEPGVGTTVLFTLPAASPAEQRSSAQAP